MSFSLDLNPKSLYAGFVFNQLRGQLNELLDTRTHSAADKEKICALLDSAVTVITPIQDHQYLNRDVSFIYLQNTLELDSISIPTTLLMRFKNFKIDPIGDPLQIEMNAEIDRILEKRFPKKQWAIPEPINPPITHFPYF